MKTKSDRVCSLQCTSIEVPLLRTTVEKIEGKTLKFDKKKKKKKKKWRCGVSNPGPLACKASALPLSYTPAHSHKVNKSIIYSVSLPDYTAQLSLITL